MAPMSKSNRSNDNNAPQLSNKGSGHRHSKSQDNSQNPVESPSSKSHASGSSKPSGTRNKEGRTGHHHHHHHRRRRSSPTLKSSLQETLSSFGDDVIRVNNWPKGYSGYENRGYFQSDISLDNPPSKESLTQDGRTSEGSSAAAATAAPYGEIPGIPLEIGGVENELAMIMSQHDPNFQTRHFEKVNPSEVGVRSSKWQKLIQTSVVSSNRFRKLRRQSRRQSADLNSTDKFLRQFYEDDGKIYFDPPFWGVSTATRTRGNLSFLTLSLILHELACFTSCVLLGCVIFQGMEAISWVQQKPYSDNWIFFKWFSSFQTLLVVITSLGFLNRVDTTEQRSLWLLPLFLVPVLGLSVSDYCNKTWELQRLECHNYFHLDEVSKQRVHLSQDCSTVLSLLSGKVLPNSSPQLQMNKGRQSPVLLDMTELDVRGIAPLIMRFLAAISILIISVYLFCARKSYYLIDSFGPPKELVGSIDLIYPGRNDKEKWINDAESRGRGDDVDEGDYVEDEEMNVNVLYTRTKPSYGRK